jgi:hypothetical protein
MRHHRGRSVSAPVAKPLGVPHGAWRVNVPAD